MPALENVRQLILGSVYSNSGRVSEAKLCYGRAIKDVNSEDNNNDHAAAFAAYELGLLLCRSDEVSPGYQFGSRSPTSWTNAAVIFLHNAGTKKSFAFLLFFALFSLLRGHNNNNSSSVFVIERLKREAEILFVSFELTREREKMKRKRAFFAVDEKFHSSFRLQFSVITF